ncbi:MAG: diguanylate cyclase, partial [Acidimicrobiia bacterium]
MDENAIIARFTIKLAILAFVVAATAVTITHGDGLGNPWMLAAFGLGAAASNWYSARITNGTDTSFSFEEAFFAAGLVVFPVPGVLAVTTFSTLLSALVTPERATKKAFNSSLMIASDSAGALAAVGVARMLGDDGAVVIPAAAIGAVASTLIAILLLNVVVSALSGQSIGVQMRETLGYNLFQPLSAITLGLLCGIAGLTFTWSPILVAPVLGMMHVVEYRHQRAIRDRQRIDGLFAVAMTAHEDVDQERVSGVITQAVTAMLSCRSATLSHEGPGDGQIGTRLESDTSVDRWLVASGAPLDKGFTDDDHYLVEAIGRIGRSALRTAELIEHIRWQGTHDERTGLPNQALFDDRVDQAIGRAMRDRERLAVVCVNLDGFRRVNESFGFDAGDEILTQVADRLHGAVREIDTVARMAADQFMLLLPSVGSPSTVSLLAQRVLEALNIPYHV